MIETLFYIGLGIVLGRLSKLRWYIGYDEAKYQAADIAIKLG